MSSFIALKAADNIAKDYDHYLKQRGWIGPDVVYSMLESSIRCDQKLLDIGIGTGLSSVQFHKAGVKVYGIDGSAEMLNECAKKNYAKELVLFDLSGKGFPFQHFKFDLIISYGVFHILGFIEPIFTEVKLRLSENGIFLFSVVENNASLAKSYEPSGINGIFMNRNNQSGILNYSHDDSYLRKLMKNEGFELWAKKSILAFKDVEENKEVYFSVYACRNMSNTHFTAIADIST
jgi:predicted TPR repeat methyltransferase